MFAILFSKAMDPFYEIFFSYPTIIFSGLLVLSVLIGAIAVLGFMDFEFLNIDLSGSESIESSSGSLSNTHVLAGLVMRFGLVGIPAPLVFFLIVLIGWMTSFLVSFFAYDFIPDGIIRWLSGTIIFIASLYFAAYSAGVFLRPFKGFFASTMNEVEKNVLGLVTTVRSMELTKETGTVDVADGGAGLILNARSFHDAVFKKGDRVVLLAYEESENYYKVISEEEFNEK